MFAKITPRNNQAEHSNEKLSLTHHRHKLLVASEEKKNVGVNSPDMIIIIMKIVKVAA